MLIDPGFGIEMAALTASWIEALTERQTVGRHVEAACGEVDVGQLVDTLGVRLGDEHVFRCAPVESDLPERAVKPSPRSCTSARAPIGRSTCRGRRGCCARRSRCRPSPNCPTIRRGSSSGASVRHRVANARMGPSASSANGGARDSETDLVRDYYRVETIDGARFWLFRDAPAEQGGRWWLHGIGEA